MNHLEHTYQAVAAGATDTTLGAGATGNILSRIIATVTAVGAGGAVSIKDGNGSAIPLVPASAAIGVYPIEIGGICRNATTPGWKVTTGASVTVVAVGKFL